MVETCWWKDATAYVLASLCEFLLKHYILGGTLLKILEDLYSTRLSAHASLVTINVKKEYVRKIQDRTER
jgi:hypothetical protein